MRGFVSVTAAVPCDGSCETCFDDTASGCTSCPQGAILSALPTGQCIASKCDVACLRGCEAPPSLPLYSSKPGVLSSLQCTGPMFQRCAAGYMPSFTKSVGCEGDL